LRAKRKAFGDAESWRGTDDGRGRAPTVARFLRCSDLARRRVPKRNIGVRKLKHHFHFERASDVKLREAAKIRILIADLDRHVRMLDRDITTEEEFAGVFDHFDPAYPNLARTLVARRDNLKDTIAALEKRLVSFALGPEGVAFEYNVICA
jgi:hypothetical protein